MTTALPLVSVMIPTYNQQQFISETLESILQQDYRPLEIVLCDDCSTDNTVEIIQTYQQRYPDIISLHQNPKNIGVTANSNLALSLCNGDFISLFAGDDVFLPGKLTAQVNALLENPKAAFCYHDVDIFDSQSGNSLGLYSNRHPLRSTGVEDYIKSGGFVCTSSVMIRREVLPTGGYNPTVRHSSDWLFLIESLLKIPSCNQITAIDKVFSRYRRHDNNITHSTNYYAADETQIILELVSERYPHLRSIARQTLSSRYLITGIKSLLHGHFKIGLKCLMKHLKHPSGFIQAFNQCVAALSSLRLFKIKRSRG